MSQGINVAGVYVNDQDEALAFYVGKLGFRVHTDARNGAYRWLTVQHPEQPSFQLGLFTPGRALCTTKRPRGRCAPWWPRARCRRWSWPCPIAAPPTRSWLAKGVEFTQEPVERYGSWDAGFRDPAGNGWKMIQAAAASA
jgi:catechol 2,3-dioxygenase-like lactoylglutathione lyase family enzyme